MILNLNYKKVGLIPIKIFFSENGVLAKRKGN